MAEAFGIVISPSNRVSVEGLQDYRPVGAFSFLGRYRLVDFPISNLSNSGIDRIQVYVSQNPRSLAEHLGSGKPYNINSKKGKLQLMFNQDSRVNDVYNTDIAALLGNINVIERMHQPYVILTNTHMIFKQDYEALLQQHIDSGADVTLLYHKVKGAKEGFQNNGILEMNRQKGLKSLRANDMREDERNLFMDTYVMKKTLFVDMIRKAAGISSIYTLGKFVAEECEDLDIRCVQHKGFFASITDLKSFRDANMRLLNYEEAESLFSANWPIYTQTTDACPVRYFKGSSVKNSMVANGSLIEGSIENCVIGRGVLIRKGAVVKNSIILGHSVIGEGVHIENQIIDKWVKVIHTKEVIATEDRPGYIRRDDVL